MPRSCKYMVIAAKSISLKHILDKEKKLDCLLTVGRAQIVSYNSLPAIIHLFLHDLGLSIMQVKTPKHFL